MLVAVGGLVQRIVKIFEDVVDIARQSAGMACQMGVIVMLVLAVLGLFVVMLA
jgi:hypothetical protein